MRALQSKLPQVGTTIFATMSGLARQHEAINLSQGFPDFPCSPELIRLVSEYMRNGYNQYAPMTGVMSLRERISEKVEKLYWRYVHPDREITVTSGATEALYAAITAVVSQGDEVIIFEPAYDSYIPAIELNGGRAIPIALEFPSYQIDWEKVKNAITEKTKLIILNSPHNPTGSVLCEDDLQKLAAIVRDTQILILSDEVYEHIIFDEKQHQSVLLKDELWERSMVVFSFGKTFHATGWKVGYCLAPEQLSKEFRKVHQFLTFSTMTPVQYALADFMENPENYNSIPSFYEEKRDFFCELLAQTPFKFQPTSGTYFQLADYSDISDEKDVKFAERITQEFGVASIPISVFYQDRSDNHIIRFCFAKEKETLERAGDKLLKIK